ncbi:MAG: PAS domain-containing protein [Desulfovibrionaceae bacterium]
MFHSVQTKLLGVIVAAMAIIAVLLVVGSSITIQRVTRAQQFTNARNVLQIIKHEIQNEYDELVAHQIDTLARYRQVMREVVPLVLGRIGQFHDETVRGWRTEDQAVSACLDWVQDFSYADGQRFFVFNKDLVFLAHGDRTRIGTFGSDYITLNGKNALEVMRDNAYKAKSSYLVFVRKASGGEEQAPNEKYMAHFMAFPQWGWVVATVMRIDVIEAEVQRKMDKILAKLKDIFYAISRANIGYAFLFSGDYKTIVHPHLATVGASKDLINPLTGNRLVDDFAHSSEHPATPLEYALPNPSGGHETKFAFVDYFKALDWYFAYTIAQKDLALPAHNLVSKLLLIILAVLFASLFVLYFPIKRYTQPLRALTGYVRDLPARDFRPGAPEQENVVRDAARSPDEIGKLASAIAAMQARLLAYVNDLSRTSDEKEHYAADLEEANALLEQRVAERTHQLTTANTDLQREVEDRTRAEERLRQYERIVSTTPDLFCLLDVQQHHLLVNDAYLETLGKDRAAVLGKTLTQVVGPLEYSQLQGVIERCLAGEVVFIERWRNHPTQGRRFRSTTYYPYRTNMGAIVGVVISSRDITDLKSAETALRASNTQLQGILTHSPSTICLTKADGAIELVNRRFEQVHGISLQRMKDTSYYDLLLPDEAQCLRAIDSNVVRTGASITQELGLTAGGVRKLFLVTRFPLFDEEGNVSSICGISTDVTESKRLEVEAMRAAQLAALGELAAGVAHEINNPINGIINYAQVLSGREQTIVDGADIPERIVEQGMRVAAIVKNLLAYARRDTGQAQPCSVSSILDDALGLTRIQLKKNGITVEIVLPEDLPMVLARATEIQQICINLLANARHSLNLRFPAHDKDKCLRITASTVATEDRQMVRIEFYDQGAGVDPDVIDHIFDPFFTTKPAHKGTGLGLSISRRIARDHKGELWLESVPGEYARAVLELPAHTPTPVA